MSEYDQKTDAAEARVQVARWSPWVWIVPVVAIFFVGYLVVRYGFFGGGDITVRFVEARGLDRYSPVRFRGAKVGTVQKITVDEKLNEVVVRITLDASMNHALRKGTRFWIVEPGIEGGGIGGLLAGTYVGIAPGEGDEAREFVGQEYAPVLAAPEAGKTFILEGHGVGALAVGSPVQFEGIRVGRVLGAAYDERSTKMSVHVFVVQRFANHVRQSTRFFRGGGLNISLDGGGVSVGDASLTSLLNSPVSFYTPEVMAGAAVAEGARFELYDSRPAAIAAADGPHLTYLTYFPGPIGGLKPGTPVQMKGMQVGRVREVRLRYLADSATLQTPVTLEIDPRLLEFQVTDATTRAELRATMNDALGKLVQKGMRASLATSLVLPGASAVNLDIMAKPGAGRLVTTTDPPIIPAAAADNGLAGAMESITEVANTIRGLPLNEIAGHIRSTTQRLDALVNDPALDQSLQRLNRSLAEIEKVATTAGDNIDPLVESLRNTASAAEAAAKRAEQILGSSQKQGYDVGELIRELTRAAESVRALSQYLSENPDALLKGRSDK
ncbi:MAG TPA: MlaD family protein [Thermoanaerobaculia bacterium]|jgi:paraquat-inducible protein B|nr:MlaD family protein [Thermoanaerobaculia bacterium]